MAFSPRRALAGVAVLAAAGLLAACTPPAPTDSGDASKLTVGVGYLYVNYDPLTTGSTLLPNQQAVLEPLFVWNQTTNDYDPVLARDWTISDDRLSMTMNLREGIDFADGTPLNAETVSEYLTALYASGTYQFTPRVVGEYGTTVEAVDEYTLEFTTTAAIAWPWFEHMSYTPIISPAVLGEGETMANEPLGGTGAYEIVEFEPEVQMTLERRDDYWNDEAYPYETVVLRVYEDPVALLNALQSGQVDAAPLPANLAVEAERAGFSIHTGSGMARFLWISDRGGEIVPALADVRVRQAMNLAFDKEGILQAIDLGYGAASSQPYLAMQDEFVEDGDDRYAYDLDKALELMDEAGYADGFALTIPSSPAFADIEPIVQQSLADINIDVTFDKFAEATGFREAVGEGLATGKYAVTMHQDFPISLARDWLIDTGNWASNGYRDAQVDEWLRTIRTGSEDEAREASGQLGEFILDEAWFAPFSKPLSTWATISGVEMVVGDVNAIPQLLSFQPVSP